MIRRIYVEKKNGFDVEAKALQADLRENLGITGLTKVRILVRYDIEGMSDADFEVAKATIFSEPQLDDVYEESAPIDDGIAFAVEYLPGQYDQRADFAEQCVQMMTQGERPRVRAGKLVVLVGELSENDEAKVKKYYINAVESHEVEDLKPETLEQRFEVPEKTPIIEGFIGMSDIKLGTLIKELGLAMDLQDILFCQKYFASEGRDPSLTEIRVLDTYWSDHCRHTTFSTELIDIDIQDKKVAEVYEDYIANRNPDKKITLMDIATGAMKRLEAEGKLAELDESEEINACSINVKLDNGEDWLVMFKNETHNHPTEIEPFGGAATCLGGAIRDPLSGRSYLYQAMRVTGCADPRKKVSETIKGKLPQMKITRTAAAGFSSYGNQIGLATGLVDEIYHEGYAAKRMEIGAVIAAAPKDFIVRERPQAGDKVILLGGRTGRDGCGGATGSSKAHDEKSLTTCGAEVQKGNPPEERKIERLFRKKEVTTLIKRCNDFGAGGVSVAIGELADGLMIDLDKVPKKYAGLNGTELAISESQERMAVVVDSKDAEKFVMLANQENLEATIVAEVTENPRLVMTWGDDTIVDLSREFLNSNGASKSAKVKVEATDVTEYFAPRKANLLDAFGSLACCSRKGMCERFDGSIGAGSVLMPFGGKTALTPTQAMAAKLPVLHGETNTVTIMSYGYSPTLSTASQFHGAAYAVVESASKIVAAGGDYKDIYFTFQEYFEKLGNDPKKWGKPFKALLGAYYAQMQLGLAAIGGKDSMSGSYLDINVPPTLVSFAVSPGDARNVVSPEFKEAGRRVVVVDVVHDEDNLPDFEDLKQKYNKIHELIKAGQVYSAFVLGEAGLAECVKMCFGNNIGLTADLDNTPSFGSIVMEVSEDADIGRDIGRTIAEPMTCGIPLADIVKAWEGTLENVFPTKVEKVYQEDFSYSNRSAVVAKEKFAKPRVIVPVFPGTNCEYDSARAFDREGADTEIFVLKNRSRADIEESIEGLAARIDKAQIIMLPGGFSAGDEPDGSAKFIVAAFRNARVKEAVERFLKQRDGLMLGICNGFQALIKLGLVPYGEIVQTDENSPTLTYNTIGRHISAMVTTRISSVLSPWMMYEEVGNQHIIPISHGEGRFVAGDDVIRQLAANGQIATQYVGGSPNGSMFGIEGITSADGRVFGKMGHSERCGSNIAKNVPGNKFQTIFKAGVSYFV